MGKPLFVLIFGLVYYSVNNVTGAPGKYDITPPHYPMAHRLAQQPQQRTLGPPHPNPPGTRGLCSMVVLYGVLPRPPVQGV